MRALILLLFLTASFFVKGQTDSVALPKMLIDTFNIKLTRPFDQTSQPFIKSKYEKQATQPQLSKAIVFEKGYLRLDYRGIDHGNPVNTFEKNQLLISGNQKIKLYKLPLTVSFNYSNLNQNRFPSNAIQVRADLKEIKLEQLHAAEKELKQLKRINLHDKEILKSLEQKSIDTLLKIKDSDLKNRFKLDSLNWQEAGKFANKSLTNSFTRIKGKTFDSHIDSINRLKNHKPLSDSSHYYLDSLTKKKDVLLLKYKEDSTRILELVNTINKIKSALNASSLDKSALLDTNIAFPKHVELKSFQVGQVFLIQNELSCQGLPIRGLELTGAKSKHILSGAVGRGQNINNLNQFNMNVIALQHGVIINRFLFVALSGIYASAPAQQFNDQVNRNITSSIEWLFKFKSIEFKSIGSSSFSNLKDNANNPEVVISPTSIKLTPGLASLNTINWKVGDFYKMRIVGRYINGQYNSLANPFLRNNFVEFEAHNDIELFKHKIKAQAYYKHLSTLVALNNDHQNKLSGYGILIASNLQKSINFLLNISPYEQGNNHPDTLFRTRSRSNIILSSLIYNKSFNNFDLNLTYSFSQSVFIDLFTPVTKYRSNDLFTQINWQDNHLFDFHFQYNNAKPDQDSLNFFVTNLDYQKVLRQDLRAGLSIRYQEYSQNSTLASIGFKLQTKVNKTIQVDGSIRVNRIYNWWNVVGLKYGYESLIRAIYSW